MLDKLRIDSGCITVKSLGRRAKAVRLPPQMESFVFAILDDGRWYSLRKIKRAFARWLRAMGRTDDYGSAF